MSSFSEENEFSCGGSPSPKPHHPRNWTKHITSTMTSSPYNKLRYYKE